MEKYIFTKKVALGFIKKSAIPGEVVSFYKNYAMFQNQKITQFRDFEICKKYGYLVPQNEYVQVKEIVKEQQNKAQGNKFGFKVKKETEETNIIPLKKFLKATEIDQNQTFVQEDGVIKEDIDGEIHVAKAQKQEQVKQEQVKNEQEIKVQGKKEEAKQQKTTAKKTAAKKTVAKKTQPKTQTVRGMKVIKED